MLSKDIESSAALTSYMNCAQAGDRTSNYLASKEIAGKESSGVVGPTRVKSELGGVDSRRRRRSSSSGAPLDDQGVC